MKPRRTTTGIVRQKACMSCGRNEHKVAIRERIMQRNPSGATDPYWTPTGQTEVRGYCNGCAPDTISHHSTLIYDRRGARAKAQKPITVEAPPAPEPLPTDAEVIAEIPRVTLGGRSLWKWCLHPAELDINGNCYTCGQRPR